MQDWAPCLDNLQDPIMRQFETRSSPVELNYRSSSPIQTCQPALHCSGGTKPNSSPDSIAEVMIGGLHRASVVQPADTRRMAGRLGCHSVALANHSPLAVMPCRRRAITHPQSPAPIPITFEASS